MALFVGMLGAAAPAAIVLTSGALDHTKTVTVTVARPSPGAALGVRAVDANAGGVVVRSIIARGPAAAAGLKRGDRIVAIDGSTIRDVGDLNAKLAALTPGSSVRISIARGSTTSSWWVVLTQQPARVATG